MIFSLVVHAPPYTGEAAGAALRFAAAALRAEHRIHRVFFFNDGAANANRLAVVPRDEVDLRGQWRKLIREHGIDATVCVSSAIQRGVVDEEQAKRHELPAASMHPEFRIGGLGELIDACLHADRTVSFG
ncbi:MAG: sulfurtransferase complex subunit TusD [Gammaproteobacteria bacterium]|nr:sulfurtransferase complex subunit TusD [Gammaproteobacteria bacterium]